MTYKVDICGRIEELPVLPLPSGEKIAFFNLHGNVPLTEHCAAKMAERLDRSRTDVLITAESKGLQLTHCLARILGMDFYAVARKSKKLYMQDGISATARSITTAGAQTLYLSAHDAALLRGKRVAVIDDVISTGGSHSALETLVETAGGTVTEKACVLAEGDAAKRDDIIFLASIPIL